MYKNIERMEVKKMKEREVTRIRKILVLLIVSILLFLVINELVLSYCDVGCYGPNNYWCWKCCNSCYLNGTIYWNYYDYGKCYQGPYAQSCLYPVLLISCTNYCP